MTENEKLTALALEARENAYAPYSGFAVGAALLAEDGTVYTGCNVENASFSATCCAERTAIYKAVSEGNRKFLKIAVAGGRAGKAPESECMPCGICRQVLREFCGDSLQILITDGAHTRITTLGALLPGSFGAETMR